MLTGVRRVSVSAVIDDMMCSFSGLLAVSIEYVFMMFIVCAARIMIGTDARSVVVVSANVNLMNVGFVVFFWLCDMLCMSI